MMISKEFLERSRAHRIKLGGGKEPRRLRPKGLLMRGPRSILGRDHWFLAIEDKGKRQLRLFDIMSSEPLSLFGRTKKSSVYVCADGKAMSIAESKKLEELLAEVERAGAGISKDLPWVYLELGSEKKRLAKSTVFEHEAWFNMLISLEEKVNRRDGEAGTEHFSLLRSPANIRNEDRVIVSASRAAASATHENNMNDMVPTGGGENVKPERLSRELSDTLRPLGEKMEGKDGESCAGEDDEVKTKHLPLGEDKVEKIGGERRMERTC